MLSALLHHKRDLRLKGRSYSTIGLLTQQLELFAMGWDYLKQVTFVFQFADKLSPLFSRLSLKLDAPYGNSRVQLAFSDK